MALLKQIAHWHDTNAHAEIVSAIEAIAEHERSYELIGLLARALNNLGREEEALAHLLSVRAQGERDPLWQFRVGYSYFYSDRAAEAVPHFDSAIELGDTDSDTRELRDMAAAAAKASTLEGATTVRATLNVNARLQPMHRHEVIEDALDERLRAAGLGYVSGGGTAMTEDGEISSCDVELSLVSLDEPKRAALLSAIASVAVPKGSSLKLEGTAIPVGELGGLALYLNGTDLPADVYANSDINEVVAETLRLLGAGFRY